MATRKWLGDKLQERKTVIANKNGNGTKRKSVFRKLGPDIKLYKMLTISEAIRRWWEQLNW